MFRFIDWLRALAAALITNSHYADIWPVSALATGGQLGNCLFFLVSGFCLYHIRDAFPRWYAKRALRIYPALWIAIGLNLLLGFFSIGSFTGFLRCFFYPTRYHFVASIMLLYILYYWVRKLQLKTGMDTRLVLGITLAVCVLVYIFVFDTSSYHIDNVEEGWVRFQFWISMLAGVRLRERWEQLDGRIRVWEWLALAVLFVGYFAAKVLVSRCAALSPVQFLSPLALLLLVYRLAVVAMKLEKQGLFAAAGRWNLPAKFLAGITLEVYLVQNVIIHHLSSLVFPLNLVVVTVLILAAAWLAHWLADRLSRGISAVFKSKGKTK